MVLPIGDVRNAYGKKSNERNGLLSNPKRTNLSLLFVVSHNKNMFGSH
jgi:hypothetical protein